jgi:hypothetical protein
MEWPIPTSKLDTDIIEPCESALRRSCEMSAREMNGSGVKDRRGYRVGDTMGLQPCNLDWIRSLTVQRRAVFNTATKFQVKQKKTISELSTAQGSPCIIVTENLPMPLIKNDRRWTTPGVCWRWLRGAREPLVNFWLIIRALRFRHRKYRLYRQ